MSEQHSPQQDQDTTSLIPAWTLGWRLQRALAHADLTTTDIADELGISRSTVSRWTNDHGAAPRAAYVKQWALRCGVPYEWLISGQEPSNGPATPGGQGISQTGCIADDFHEAAVYAFPVAA